MHTNDQDIQVSDGRMLPLVEEFYTVQGEGFHTGKAAYFIRIGGCDVGCSWCDTKFSWNPSLHPLVAVEEIIAHAAVHPAAAVVVTGGEPLMNDMGPLTKGLHDEGIETFLETSGAYPLSGDWDWICLSPKKNMPPAGNIHQHAHELKVIISSVQDFEWAVEQASFVSDDCHLFLQPEWSVSKAMIPEIVEFVKEHPRWNISVQAHKYMRIP